MVGISSLACSSQFLTVCVFHANNYQHLNKQGGYSTSDQFCLSVSCQHSYYMFTDAKCLLWMAVRMLNGDNWCLDARWETKIANFHRCVWVDICIEVCLLCLSSRFRVTSIITSKHRSTQASWHKAFGRRSMCATVGHNSVTNHLCSGSANIFMSK